MIKKLIRRTLLGLGFAVLGAMVILGMGASIAGCVAEMTEMRPTPVAKFAVLGGGLAALFLLQFAFRQQDRIRNL